LNGWLDLDARGGGEDRTLNSVASIHIALGGRNAVGIVHQRFTVGTPARPSR